MKLCASAQQSPSEKRNKLTISNFLGTWSGYPPLESAHIAHEVGLICTLHVIGWNIPCELKFTYWGRNGKNKEMVGQSRTLLSKDLPPLNYILCRRFVNMTNYNIVPQSTKRSSSSTQDVSGVACVALVLQYEEKEKAWYKCRASSYQLALFLKGQIFQD